MQMTGPRQMSFSEIPGYAGMSESDRTRYAALYAQAMDSKLLREEGALELSGIDSSKLPGDIADLHALVYFIFQYNLSHFWTEDGVEVIRIRPFIPMQWTQAKSLNMAVGGRYALLLNNLAPLQPSIALYFSVLMLSIAMMRGADPETKNYHQLMMLLVAMLDGHYDQAMLNTLQLQASDLHEPWLVKYLPNPATMVVATDDNVRQVRRYLLGDSLAQGIFPPPRELREADDLSQAAAVSSPSNKKSVCLIL